MASEISLETGNEVEAYCGKCKVDTGHIVVEVQKEEETIKKVVCQTCKAKHNYTKPKKLTDGKPAQKKSTPRKSTRRKAGNKWAAMVSSLEESEVVDYSMARNYSEDSLIKHPVFGIGVVTKLINSTRIEVQFETGVKLMVINKK